MSAPGAGQDPLVLVGTGRCGSTLLHRLLARHEDLGWLSTFNEVFPGQPWLGAFSRLYHWPLPDRLKEAKAFPKPFECYRFWEHYLPGFSRRDRPQTAADVHAAGIEPARRATARVLRLQRRPRLLVKVTGWSRIAYFDRIYPDARFVSLRRDPRSVVSSWMKAGWLDVTSPPDGPDWQWGEVPPRLLDLWRELGGTPALSVALKIRLDLDDIHANMALFEDRCHELSYEDLITAPDPTLKELCDFAGLPWSAAFERTIREQHFYDSRDRWRSHLSEEEGGLVVEFLRRSAQPG
jgi:omega-hydroxy-beta-dihydromenaquinone-9 sulfotransferase